jgi:predicted Zn-dependent protease
MSTTSEELESIALRAAEKAIALFTARHPRPAHVSVVQAAEMLGLDRHTVSRLCRMGVLQRNAMGLIPSEQVDRALRPVDRA